MTRIKEEMVNPLLAMSFPLLLIATELPHRLSPADMNEFYQECCSQIKLFEKKALQLKRYSSAVILAARFFLCALIDEFILNTAWGKKSAWKEKNLLKTFQREAQDQQHFFTILDNAKQDPKHYIDVIELGYVCLSLGYQDNYKNATDHSELNSITEQTYTFIKNYRGDFKKNILLPEKIEKIKRKKMLKLPPIWLTTLATIIILSGVFMSYYRQLENINAPLKQLISTVIKFNGE